MTRIPVRRRVDTALFLTRVAPAGAGQGGHASCAWESSWFRCWRARGDAFAIDLPHGFHAHRSDHGRTNLPTGVYFAHDGRVFVTEKSGRDLGLPEPSATPIRRSSPTSAPTCTTSGIAACSASRSIRVFPKQPYVYVQYAFNGGLFDDPPPRWPACATASDSRPDRQPSGGCVISGHVSRLTVDGNTAGRRAGARRGLVPAVSRAIRSARSSSVPTAISMPAAATVRASTSTISASPAIPTGPTSARRRTKADRCARRGSKTKPHTPIRCGSTDRSAASIPRPAPAHRAIRSPAAATRRTRSASSRTVSAIRSASRFVRAAARSGSAMSARTSGKKSTAFRRCRDRRATLKNFGWPCFEGRDAHAGFDVPICTHLYARYRRTHAGDAAVVHVQPRALPTPARFGHHRPRVLRRHRLSAAVPGLAVLRRQQPHGRSSTFRTSMRTRDGIPDPPADDNATAVLRRQSSRPRCN